LQKAMIFRPVDRATGRIARATGALTRGAAKYVHAGAAADGRDDSDRLG
jgi:hypothetical protein